MVRQAEVASPNEVKIQRCFPVTLGAASDLPQNLRLFLIEQSGVRPIALRAMLVFV